MINSVGNTNRNVVALQVKIHSIGPFFPTTIVACSNLNFACFEPFSHRPSGSILADSQSAMVEPNQKKTNRWWKKEEKLKKFSFFRQSFEVLKFILFSEKKIEQVWMWERRNNRKKMGIEKELRNQLFYLEIVVNWIKGKKTSNQFFLYFFARFFALCWKKNFTYRPRTTFYC